MLTEEPHDEIEAHLPTWVKLFRQVERRAQEIKREQRRKGRKKAPS